MNQVTQEVATEEEALESIASRGNKQRILAILYREDKYLSYEEISNISSIKIDSLRAYISRIEDQYIEKNKSDSELQVRLTERGRQEISQEIKQYIDNQKKREKILSEAQEQSAESNNILQALRSYIKNNLEAELLEAIRNGVGRLEVNFQDFAKKNPSAADLVLDQPENSIKAGSIAIEQLEGEKDYDLRFYNLPSAQYVRISDLRTDNLGQFHTIEGMISSVVPARPRVVSARFECPSCGNIISKLMLEDTFKEPGACKQCGRKGKFKLLDKKLEDVITMKVEETPEQLTAEENPQDVIVQVRRDLANKKIARKYNPGARVRISGVLKEIPKYIRNNVQSVDFNTLFEANMIDFPTDSEQNVELTEEDRNRYREWAEKCDDDLQAAMEDFCEDFAPNIYGHEAAKKAVSIILHTPTNDPTSEDRTMSHMMWVGDPGIGKSQIGRWTADMMPRSRYATGESSTGVGFTAAVIKDNFTKEWTVSGGVLPKANGGLVVIDEFDKASDEDIEKLHTALEHGEIPINKADINTKLPAHVRLIALLNPKSTRFTDWTTLGDEIPGVFSLKNRFDIIHASRDTDTSKDREITRRIFSVTDDNVSVEKDMSWYTKKMAFVHEKRRLPKLSEDAKKYLEDYYVEVRGQMENGGAVPVNPRTFRGWGRLARGVSIFRHSWLTDGVVSVDDVKLAIDIWSATTGKVLSYDGGFDVDRIEGVSYIERDQKEIILSIIRESGSAVCTDELQSALDVSDRKISSLLNQLSSDTEIFESKPGFWRVL